MSKLALHGGTPVFARPLAYQEIWPPVDDTTATKLVELYRSRRWTAFDETERDFSQAFAARHDARHGVFVPNGTITLQIALSAVGVGSGDEVIITPLTWYATAMAVRHVGARPVFVDIKPDTLCLDPEKIEQAITPRTRAIIPVHAYGSMADMDRIMDVARRYDLRVIEDCAHMHGGSWNGRGVGSIGDVGSFSFQNSKTMSSGEGGICVTDDPDLYERLFRIKQIGYAPGDQPRKAKSGPPEGLVCYNFRTTAFHPLILGEQLRLLDDRLDRYRAAVAYLEDRLGSTTKLRFQVREPKTDRQGYFGFVMMFDAPEYADVPIDVIHRAIEAEGAFLIRAEGPIYKFILFNLRSDEYDVPEPCVVTEATCDRALWLLHVFLDLSHDELGKMADAIEKVLGNLDALR